MHLREISFFCFLYIGFKLDNQVYDQPSMYIFVFDIVVYDVFFF
jgi:hypothetical protein